MKLIQKYWENFIDKNPNYKETKMPQYYYFCDNKKSANECAELVVKKIKQATSPSLWWYKKYNEEIPKKGDLTIVTDWDGNPKAIIEILKVEIVKFKNISEEYAKTEGEGDKTLDYWKKTHWDYYKREMEKEGDYPSEDMEIVCEIFKTIW